MIPFPGHTAPATRENTHSLLWVSAIHEVLCNHGVSGDWLRESPQRERLFRYYHAGEPAGMAADALYQFWLGHERAKREDADGMNCLRSAPKS